MKNKRACLESCCSHNVIKNVVISTRNSDKSDGPFPIKILRPKRIITAATRTSANINRFQVSNKFYIGQTLWITLYQHKNRARSVLVRAWSMRRPNLELIQYVSKHQTKWKTWRVSAPGVHHSSYHIYLNALQSVWRVLDLFTAFYSDLIRPRAFAAASNHLIILLPELDHTFVKRGGFGFFAVFTFC